MSQTDVDRIDFMDPDVQEDWFPYYRQLREEAPVWQVPSTGEYFLSRYDDVLYVLRHPELFPHTSTSSEFRRLETEPALRYYEEHGWTRKTALGVDPPVHREYRILVDPWFSAAGAEQQRPVIERLPTSLMDDWIDDGEVELVGQFAMPLPVMVITSVLGFPLGDIEHLKRCPGEGLSKLEQRIAAEQFLARMGNLRVTPDRNDFTHVRGFWLRPSTNCTSASTRSTP